jgi:hypothetical protein
MITRVTIERVLLLTALDLLGFAATVDLTGKKASSGRIDQSI